MEKKSLTDIIMNPVRLRIIQYLMIHKQGTTAMIKQELSDIPPASLYRHIKILFEAGYIEVVKENKVRGVVEKVYQLAKEPFVDANQQNVDAVIQSGLFSLMNSFQMYFKEKDVDPVRDMLTLSTSTLLLTDEEFIDVLKKFSGILNEVITNQPAEGRKQRRITLISSPCEK